MKENSHSDLTIIIKKVCIIIVLKPNMMCSMVLQGYVLVGGVLLH